jgi:hypothetical protein
MVDALDSGAELKNHPQNQQIGCKIFTMVHHSSLTAYIHGITTISLVGFT